MKPVDPSAADARKFIADEAACWYAVLHGDVCSSADRQAFAEWVARSPECVAAYLRISSALGAIQSAQLPWPETSVEALVAEAKAQGAVAVLPGSVDTAIKQGRGGPWRDKWRPLWLPAVAAAALLIICVGTWVLMRAAHSYETDIGEQRSVMLQDGSVVTLNTASRIDVDLRADRRIIHLDRGEALFQVARDAARPFDVIVGAVTVHAVGTEFDIDRRGSRTTVTVVEGRVRVSTKGTTTLANAPQATPGTGSVQDAILTASERVVIAGNVLSAPERIDSVTPVTAWTQRRLIFERHALGEVAEEFNRYNRRRIFVVGSSLREQEVTGLFQANDPDSFVEFLGGIPDVRVERNENGDYFVRDDREKSSSGGGPN